MCLVGDFWLADGLNGEFEAVDAIWMVYIEIHLSSILLHTIKYIVVITMLQDIALNHLQVQCMSAVA